MLYPANLLIEEKYYKKKILLMNTFSRSITTQKLN